MTPQEWIKDTLDRWPAGHHVAEGATHLAAALEEIARLRAEAGRAVVPELTEDQAKTVENLKVMMRAGVKRRHTVVVDFYPQACQDVIAALEALETCSVTASRVLKDGEVAVDAEEWTAMCDLGFDPEPCRLDHHGCCQEHNWFGEKPCPTAILQRLYALRTQATAPKGAGDDS